MSDEEDAEHSENAERSEDAKLPTELREGSDPDWQRSPDSEDAFQADADRRAFLRTIAEDVRGESSESKQLSAILYRVSDLYDPEEETSPEEIYLNVRRIMQIKARGGLKRE